MTEAFSELALLKDQTSAYQPVHFKKIINSQMPLFYGNAQHDAAELLNFFLDKISEEMNRVEPPKQTKEEEN